MPDDVEHGLVDQVGQAPFEVPDRVIARRRPLTDEDVVQVNRAVRRRANLGISAALLGVLLLCWFVIPGVAAPMWAVAIAVLLLFIAVVPLMRKEDIINALGR